MKSVEIEMSGAHRAQPPHPGLVFQRRIAALHEREHAVGAALHRQVQVVGELRHVGERLDQAVVELERVRGGEADALDARHARHVVDERRQIEARAVSHRAAVGVDVLAEQRDLAHALGGELPHLLEHRVEAAADFLAARVGHDAEAAVLAAAFHDRDEGARALQRAAAGRWSNFSISGKLTSTTARPVRRRSAIICGQPVQRLRAEHQVDERRALGDRLALLAGDAAAHADQHARGGAL